MKAMVKQLSTGSMHMSEQLAMKWQILRLKEPPISPQTISRCFLLTWNLIPRAYFNDSTSAFWGKKGWLEAGPTSRGCMCPLKNHGTTASNYKDRSYSRQDAGATTSVWKRQFIGLTSKTRLLASVATTPRILTTSSGNVHSSTGTEYHL